MRSSRLALSCSVLTLLFYQSVAVGAPSLAQCHGLKDLVFVAHQDDDLLFMNPDIENTLDAGGCVQTVYLTAAERGEGAAYMEGRARGVRAAYAHMMAAPNRWTEHVTLYGGKHQARFTLDQSSNVALLHMRLEDPWLGKGWGSLTPLSQAESVAGSRAKALGPYRESYDRNDLVRVLAAIIRDYQPTVVRHMDASITIPYTALCWGCAGHDHPDHIASARLVRDAMAVAPGHYQEAGYVDYPTQERVANLTASEIAGKTDAFRLYAKDDYRYCPHPAQCNEPAGTAAAWVARTYYVVHRLQPPALLADGTSGYLLFATGELNNAANVLRSTDKAWSALGGRTAGAVVAFNRADGEAGVIARDASGRLWANGRLSRDRWQGWRLLSTVPSVDLPVVANTGSGQPAALVLGNDGLFRYTEQLTPLQAGPAHWITLPVLPNPGREAALALDANGSLAAFALDQAGRVWVASQTGTGGAAWSGWQRIKGVRTSGGLAAIRNRRGKIELYARDKKSGSMLQLTQRDVGPASGRWARPLNLGLSFVGRPSVAMNEKGEVAVAALEHAGGALWLVEGQSVTSLGGGIESTPTLRTVNGTLYLASRSNEATQTYRVWQRSKGGWQPVSSFEAPMAAGGASFFSAAVKPPGVQAPLAALSASVAASAMGVAGKP